MASPQICYFGTFALVLGSALGFGQTGCTPRVPPVASPVTSAVPASLNPGMTRAGAPPPPPPPSEPEMDRQTGTVVRQVLKRPELAEASQNVSVSVKKGIVTLTGRVPDSQVRSNIVNEIDKIPGVDRVDDQLVIRP